MIKPDFPSPGPRHGRPAPRGETVRREFRYPQGENTMVAHKRFTGVLITLASFLMLPCFGCSESFQEDDATQVAMNEVQQSYPDPESVMCKAMSVKRRADSGWTVRVAVLPVQSQGNVTPNFHEVDMTPDRAIVDHLVNGQDLPSED